MSCYDPASRPCASGPQPGTVALRDAVMEVWDWVTNLGIFNCRPVNHPSNSGPSVHGNGRAPDLGIPVNHRANGDGHKVAQALCDEADVLGLQFIVYDRRKWGCEYLPVGAPFEDWLPYGGYPHEDHIHAEQTIEASKRLTYEQALAALTGQEDWMAPVSEEDFNALVEEVKAIRRSVYAEGDSVDATPLDKYIDKRCDALEAKLNEIITLIGEKN